MNVAQIKEFDIADGPGVRVALYTCGCTHKCPGCHNKELQDFNYGIPWTKEQEDKIISLCKSPYIRGLSILGGEPFEPNTQRELLPFLTKWKKEIAGKTIWCWTGCRYESELASDSPWRCEVTDEVLNQIDVLVDGPFEIDKKDLRLKYRGSSNQRILALHPYVKNITSLI